MRFLVDECCEAGLMAALRAAGHDVRYVAEDDPSSVDRDILALACAERRILVTDDKGFGDLVFRDKLPTAGIVLIRVDQLNPTLRLRRLLNVVGTLEARLFGQIVVIGPHLTRVRMLPS